MNGGKLQHNQHSHASQYIKEHVKGTKVRSMINMKKIEETNRRRTPPEKTELVKVAIIHILKKTQFIYISPLSIQLYRHIMLLFMVSIA